MKKHKILCVITAIVLTAILTLTPTTAFAASAPTLNSTNVTLFGLEDSFTSYISLPSSYPVSFQFKVSGTTSAVKWKVKSGRSVTITDNGLVKPRITTYYWVGNIGSTVSSGDPNEKVTHEYSFGESVITATVDGQTLQATVNVNDYAKQYADDTIDNYIAKNITSSMTDMQKIKKVCEFVASYDYSPYASGYIPMIVKKGGDCWASVSCVNTMCDRLNIPCNTRYAVNDAGAGSGHRNNVVLLDGQTYLVDTGYSGTAPRYYALSAMTNGFTFSSNSTGISVTQYDGFDTELTIPETTKNKPITEIGPNLLYYNQSYNGIYVTKVNIPSTVTSIDALAFSGSEQLTNVSVSPANSPYCDINGVVYTKDKKQVVYYPNGLSGAYNVPSGVTTIGEYGFYYSKNLTSVTLPSGVTTLMMGAFGDCTHMSSISLPETLKTINDFAFYNCFELESITIPKSVTTISDDAFNASTMTIYGYSGSAAETFATNKGYTFVALDDILYGDTNGDGRISIVDATNIQKYLVGIITADEIDLVSADADKNGRVTIADATAVQKICAGI